MTQSGPIPEASDEDLAVARNVGALYERYAHRLLPFLASLGVRDECLDDVHQDVWLRVCRALPKMPHHEHFRAWLFKLARNLVIDGQRARRDVLPLPGDLGGQHELAPLDGLVRAKEEALLEGCLKELGADEANAFRLRLAGATYPEVCESLGIDMKTAYRLCEEAKKKLTRCVRKAEP